jgi:hypothetical protein
MQAVFLLTLFLAGVERYLNFLFEFVAYLYRSGKRNYFLPLVYRATAQSE